MDTRSRLSIAASLGLLVAVATGCNTERTEDERAVDEEWTARVDQETAEADPPVETPSAARRPDLEEGAGVPDWRESIDLPAPTESDEEPEFVAHEWGTFTSVAASNGEYLPGLHHEEESLPAFVHQLDYEGVGDPDGPKGIPRAYVPEPVTQKLETPVIYFYTDEPRQVDVEVDFPNGYITEWYPDAVDYQPSLPRECVTRTGCGKSVSELGLDKLGDGRMAWDVEISNETKDLVEVPPEDIWAPSREVPDAAYVSHGEDADKFIFYRGIGKAEPPFEVRAEQRSTNRPAFSFENHSEETIPSMYLLWVTEDRGRIVSLDSLAGGESSSWSPAPKEAPKPQYLERAKSMVKQGLVETGLTGAESEAMVETWSRSYFERPGIRVLYVLPRTWTDEMLPIEISPEPDELVRTLVGRVEVLTPRVEKQAAERIRRAFAEGKRLIEIADHGRFAEPRFRRGCQLVDGEEIQQWCERQLREMRRRVMYEARDE